MLKSIKGFNDILHIETESTRPSSEWRQLESSLIDVLNQFGFEQIRLPIVEETQLFARAIGITYCGVIIQNFGILVLCFAMNNRKKAVIVSFTN